MAKGTASVTEERAVTADVGPVLVRWTAPDALSNLVSVLELAADGQVRYSASTRRPTAATVKLVEDVLVAGDFYDSGEPIAALAWPLLIQVGGLVRLTGTRLELSPRGRAVLARPSYEALGALWARWLRSVSTDELARIEAIKGQRKPGTLTSATTRRAAVAAALAALQPGAWTGAGKLLASLTLGEDIKSEQPGATDGGQPGQLAAAGHDHQAAGVCGQQRADLFFVAGVIQQHQDTLAD